MINISLPKRLSGLHDPRPEDYVLSQELADAVQVALTLEQPLLITGEPGTGKTRLADRVAYDLHQADNSFRETPLRYTAQTTSSAQDLLYRYDTLRHFHDVNLRQAEKKGAPPISDYIQLEALGEAIARTRPDEAGAYLPAGTEAQSSVVLIDEVDKAPRDFPNNLLLQLDEFTFGIKEDPGQEFRLGQDKRVVVILTSNSEKSLPEAFLRRCVFFNIPFPDKEHLLQIVRARLGQDSQYASDELIQFFLQLRNKAKRKAPATAELLAWLRILELHQFLGEAVDFRSLSGSQREILRLSLSVLAKTRDDLEAYKGFAQLT